MKILLSPIRLASHTAIESLFFLSDGENQQENRSLNSRHWEEAEEKWVECMLWTDESGEWALYEAKTYRVQSRSQLIVTSSHKIHETRKCWATRLGAVKCVDDSHFTPSSWVFIRSCCTKKWMQTFRSGNVMLSFNRIVSGIWKSKLSEGKSIKLLSH